MRKTKKILLIALSLCMCTCAFASCGDNADDTQSSQIPQDSSTSSESEQSVQDNSTIESSQTSEEPEKTIPPVPELITSYPSKFTKVSDSSYKVECTASDGSTLLLTFTEKSWGTYNLGAWKLVTKNEGTLSFGAGATDWEYVYRAGSDNSKWVWSGGNHGNEKLVSLNFYDGTTEKEIILESGQSIELDNLLIVEKTKLHWGDEAVTYADVERRYTVTGPQIKLNVNYNYTSDCYCWLSYTCMFPISKKYGLYCDMIGEDNKLIKTIETLKVGAADYSGAMNDGNAATRAIIYGYVDDKYKFDVRVTTKQDSLDGQKNSFKTAFWDMNTTDNKLYFSKYDANSPTLVPAGSTFSTECIWYFSIDG